MDPELPEGLALASSTYDTVFFDRALLCIIYDVFVGRGRSGGCSAPVALCFPLTVLLQITFELLLSQPVYTYIYYMYTCEKIFRL